MSRPAATTNEQKALDLIKVLEEVGTPTPNLIRVLQEMLDMGMEMDAGGQGDKQVAHELLSTLTPNETMVWRLGVRLAKSRTGILPTQQKGP